MKENKKVRNVLQKYMQWPVVLSVLVLCANGAVGLVSGKAGMVMAVFTVLYAFCAGVLFWYGKKRILTGLVGCLTASPMKRDAFCGPTGRFLR